MYRGGRPSTAEMTLGRGRRNQVFCRDEETGVEDVCVVTETFSRTGARTLEIVLRARDGTRERFATTAEHPFFTGSFVPAGHLRSGDLVHGLGDRLLVVESVSWGQPPPFTTSRSAASTATSSARPARGCTTGASLDAIQSRRTSSPARRRREAAPPSATMDTPSSFTTLGKGPTVL